MHRHYVQTRCPLWSAAHLIQTLYPKNYFSMQQNSKCDYIFVGKVITG